MKPLTLIAALAISLFGVCLPTDHLLAQESISAELKVQAEALVKAYGEAYRSKNVDQMMELFDPDLGGALLAVYRVVFEGILDNEFTSVEISITAVEPTATRIAVRISLVERYSTGEAREEERPGGHILFARQRDDGLVVVEFAEEILGTDFDTRTRIYHSPKGGYSLEVPEGWILVKGSPELAMIVPDPIVLLAPDLESVCIVAFVQLPIRMSAKEAVEADVAVASRMTHDHRILKEGPAAVKELEGYSMVSEYSEATESAKGQSGLPSGTGIHRRMRVYFSSPPLLYFFMFDAFPRESFDVLKPDFDAIIAGFEISTSETDRTTQEVIAEKLAQGGVSGRVYTSEEYNCFIAAPEGWEIQTSPNLAHLVEMQYQKGKSIARLLAVKGLPSGPDVLEKSVEERLEAVKGIVENFNEVSRSEVTVHQVPGIESIHTYSLEGLGGFHVKEVTVVRDGIYYLILCQAIEPDSFENLEPDFDQIIASFGFIQ